MFFITRADTPLMARLTPQRVLRRLSLSLCAVSVSLMLAACGATPTAAPTATQTATLTPTNLPTATLTPTNVPTRTPTATAAPTASATPTNLPIATATPTPAATVAPTNTPSPIISGQFDGQTFGLAVLATGLEKPIFVTHAGDGSNRLFIVEKRGVIRIWQAGQLLATPFLDISTLVRSSSSEQGLLGLAFAPDFASNRLFFVNYTKSKERVY